MGRRKKKITRQMDDAPTETMRQQYNAFIARFGREPTAHDPVFFCWHSTTPKPMCDLCNAEYEHGVVEAAKKAGIDPARALKALGAEDPLGSLKTTN
jgi:hypothetical protein